MKPRIFITFLGIFLFSCEEVIELELPVATPKLVIDAQVASHISTPNDGHATVKISQTVPYYNDSIPPFTAATVSITDMSNNTKYVLTQQETSGVYEANLPLSPTTRYALLVEANAMQYTSEAAFVPGVKIDSVSQGDGVLFTGNETEVILSFTDPAETENFYFIDFGFDEYFTSQDRFYNGSPFNFSYFYDEDFPKGTPTEIRMEGIDEAFFSYLRILLSQSGQNSGGPFSTPSSALRGNIINQSDSEQHPYGYFRISGYDTITFVGQ